MNWAEKITIAAMMLCLCVMMLGAFVSGYKPMEAFGIRLMVFSVGCLAVLALVVSFFGVFLILTL